MRRNDVASTSFRRRVPTRFLINQCQIITFLILKYNIIENSRIELRGIVLPVLVGGLLGGAKGYVGPPSQIIGGAWPPLAPPLPTPMSRTPRHWKFTQHHRTTRPPHVPPEPQRNVSIAAVRGAMHPSKTVWSTTKVAIYTFQD